MIAVEDAPAAPPIMGVEALADEPRRRRHELVWAALGALFVTGAGIGIWLWTSNATSVSSSAVTAPLASAVVERGTISASDSWEGTLEYGTPFTVRSSADGTITRLIEPGATVERGDELYRVNEQPVTLLYGAVPMYRDLGPGASGVDVEQLEMNLGALGYDGFTPDDQYDASTAAAVRAWQDAIGAEQTGTVGRGHVVFAPDGGRVDALWVEVGDAGRSGVAVLDITATELVVSLAVDIDDRDRFDTGTEVTIVLPGGDEVTGTVGTTAVVKVTSDESGQASPGGTTEPESIAQVTVSVEGEVPDDLVGASVDVIVAIDERVDVLLVPVNALLALAEGGYGLEVLRDDGTTEMVAVDTGLFADGRVEVSGAGIDAGAVVGTAGR